MDTANLKPRHRELSHAEKSNFLLNYRNSQDWLYKLLLENKYLTGVYYSIIFLCFLMFGLKFSLDPLTVLLVTLLSWVASTLTFAIGHTQAHATFLDYDSYVNSSKSNYLPVAFFGFYHHHNSPPWGAPVFHNIDELGNDSSHEVAFGNLMSHWHAFSMLGVFRFYYFFPVSICLYFLPIETILFVLSYEFFIFLLPFSHVYLHDYEEKLPGFMSFVFNILTKLGIYASRKEHAPHHIHTHPAVYKSFTSSGLYNKYIDKMMDKIFEYLYDNKSVQFMKSFFYIMLVSHILIMPFSLFLFI